MSIPSFSPSGVFGTFCWQALLDTLGIGQHHQHSPHHTWQLPHRLITGKLSASAFVFPPTCIQTSSLGQKPEAYPRTYHCISGSQTLPTSPNTCLSSCTDQFHPFTDAKGPAIWARCCQLSLRPRTYILVHFPLQNRMLKVQHMLRFP